MASRRLLRAGIALALLVVGGLFAYRHFTAKKKVVAQMHGGPVVPGRIAMAPSPGPFTMSIDCAGKATPISPYVFGVAFAEAPEELFATAYRWGGNTTSRYNWKLGDAWSTGSDWYFRNVDTTPYTEFLEQSRKRGAYVALTVPLIGWVAKDKTSYSFPVSVYGAQKSVDPVFPDMGNGRRKGGEEIAPGDPARTSVAMPPESIGAWVRAIREADAKIGARQVHEYILDNEPSLWNSTHRDVHPEPLTYDELLQKTVAFATEIRKADPEARIAGPAAWGWPEYFFSAKDAAAGFKRKPDRRAHGDVPLLQWYLGKLREHEQKTGVRLLDVLDVHVYPQGDDIQTVEGGGGTDVETSARRFRATRALWDEDYEDESWIHDTVKLIPRMKAIIDKGYPGLGLSIGEYNFGAEGHISGALALAEALGRFAEGGVTSAFYWKFPKPKTPVYWAFRAFRNYDGKGARFGSESLAARAPEGTSLFASRDPGKRRVVAIAVNFDAARAFDANIDASSCGEIVRTKRWVYTGTADGLVASADEPGGAAIRRDLPPYSITVIELELAKP